jgi:hypothetical protein
MIPARWIDAPPVVEQRLATFGRTQAIFPQAGN